MMTTLIGRLATVLVTTAIAGTAYGRSDIPWNGPYLGLNIGNASSNTCNSWGLIGPTISPTAAGEFNNRECSKTDAPVLGVQIGQTIQFKRLVIGAGADLEYWRTRTFNQSTEYSGVAPPPGRYSFSGKITPDLLAVIGPRIGYAGDTWLPYLRAGAILTAGSHNSELFYTPTGAKLPTDSFNGSKNSSSTGWAAGGGFELGLNGAWSISAEYLHATLSKGSSSSASCIGSALTCAEFPGISFVNAHGGFSANIIRVGITYWFDYW